MKNTFIVGLCLLLSAASLWSADNYATTKEVLRRIVGMHQNPQVGYDALNQLASNPDAQGNVQLLARNVGGGLPGDDAFTTCESEIRRLPFGIRMVTTDCDMSIPAAKLKALTQKLRLNQGANSQEI